MFDRIALTEDTVDEKTGWVIRRVVKVDATPEEADEWLRQGDVIEEDNV